MSTGAWRQSLQCCTTRENMGLQQLPLGHPWPSQSQKGKTRFLPAPALAWQYMDSLFSEPWTGLDGAWRWLTLSRALYQKAWGKALAFQQKGSRLNSRKNFPAVMTIRC